MMLSLVSVSYTHLDLHCCFNIYRRPENGELHSMPVAKLKDITIYRQDSKGYKAVSYTHLIDKLIYIGEE